jgi:hypothetical protein
VFKAMTVDVNTVLRWVTNPSLGQKVIITVWDADGLFTCTSLNPEPQSA